MLDLAGKQKFLRVMVIIFLAALLLPGIVPFCGQVPTAFASGDYDLLAVKAVQKNYEAYAGGTKVDGGYGNFGAYDAYVLTRAGADVSKWVYNNASFKTQVEELITATLANESTIAQKSPAKRVANEYLVAKTWGNAKAADLLQILQDRQNTSQNGGFDEGDYSAYSNLPAFDALGRAGDINLIDKQKAVDYLLSQQETGTGGWPKAWPDFQSTAQAVRALAYLTTPDVKDQPETVQQAVYQGLAWMQSNQQTDGSFKAGDWDDPLIDTVEAINTLHVLGIDPATWVKEGKTPLDYMREKAFANGQFGSMGNVADNTWALDAYCILGGNPLNGTVLTISPQDAEISVGESKQFTVSAIKFNGIEVADVTASADWSVDDATKATIDKGLVTGIAGGSVKVKAAYQGNSTEATLRIKSAPVSPLPETVRVSVRVIGKDGEPLYTGKLSLTENDRWGITALGALAKTGLSYSVSRDFDGFVIAIEGQKNSGMNGWMYKVNDEVPTVLAKDYQVADGDEIIWWYSTNPDEIPDKNSKVIPPSPETAGVLPAEAIKTEADKALNAALTKTGEAKLSLAGNDAKAQITPRLIQVLAAEAKPLTVESRGVSLKFPPQSLITPELQAALKADDAYLELGAKVLTDRNAEEIVKLAGVGETTGLFAVGGEIVDLVAQTVRMDGGETSVSEKIGSFSEPVAVTIALPAADLTEADIANLTGIRYEKTAEGKIVPVKLGGSYDRETKTFTFYTDKFSLYGVLKAKNLNQATLKIDEQQITCNGNTKTMDVAPTIMNNRTMVPIRFVAESLGAEVDWVGDTQTVNIKLGDKNLSMRIGVTGPGLDTPPVIVNNRTLVPLRYVSECLGAQVLWFPSTRTVQIVQ